MNTEQLKSRRKSIKKHIKPGAVFRSEHDFYLVVATDKSFFLATPLFDVNFPCGRQEVFKYNIDMEVFHFVASNIRVHKAKPIWGLN